MTRTPVSALESETNPNQLDMLEAYLPVQESGGRRSGNVKRDKETGMGKALLTRVESDYAGNPMRQVDEYFDRFKVPAATGVKRKASLETQRYYVKRLKVTIKDLAEMNIKLRGLSELSRKHVLKVTRKWEEEGQSSSAMANKNTVLRRFGNWIGKPDLCPPLPELLLDPSRAKRTYSALTPKTITARQIDPELLFQEMDKECLVTGLQLRLQLHFGLRVMETVMFKPFASDRGNDLFVLDGTKGGKARMVPIETEKQRQLLEEAKAYAAGNVQGILTDDPKRKLQKSVWRYYNLCKKIGFTQKDLGVTSHSLRHTFANEVYKKATGTESPVNGGEKVSRDLDHAAQRQVSQVLGHARRSITAAYLGNHVTIERHRRLNMKTLISKLESSAELRQAVQEEGVESFWVVGPEAEGEMTSKLMMVTSLRAGRQETGHEGCLRLSEIVGRLMGKPCIHISHAASQSQKLETLEMVWLVPGAAPYPRS